MSNARDNSMTKVCGALFKCENKLKISWKKLIHNLEEHSNESACRKSGRLGIDQVTN